MIVSIKKNKLRHGVNSFQEYINGASLLIQYRIVIDITNYEIKNTHTTILMFSIEQCYLTW